MTAEAGVVGLVLLGGLSWGLVMDLTPRPAAAGAGVAVEVVLRAAVPLVALEEAEAVLEAGVLDLEASEEVFGVRAVGLEASAADLGAGSALGVVFLFNADVAGEEDEEDEEDGAVIGEDVEATGAFFELALEVSTAFAEDEVGR